MKFAAFLAVGASLAVAPAALAAPTSNPNLVFITGSVDGEASVQLQRKEGPGAIGVSGNLASDFQVDPRVLKGTYSATTGAGTLSFTNSFKATPTVGAPGEGLFGASTKIDGVIRDRLTTVGGVQGQHLIFHNALSITGGTTFSLGTTPPESSWTTLTDLSLSAAFASVPEGDFFPADPAAGPVWEAITHQGDGMRPSFDRVLDGPRVIPYEIAITVGEALDFDFQMELNSSLTSDEFVSESLSSAYKLQLSTEQGFFTLADDHFRDTGIRTNPGVQLVSSTGFDYLSAHDAIGGGGAGAVPEPASWALMISGFGLMGAALRRRRGPSLA